MKLDVFVFKIYKKSVISSFNESQCKMIFCQHVDHLQDDLHGEAVEELNTDIEEVLVRSEGYISVDRTIPGYHIRSASYNSEVSLYKISD